MPENGSDPIELDDDDLDLDLEYEPAPDFVMTRPNELLGNVGSLSSVVFGPRNLEVLLFEEEEQHSGCSPDWVTTHPEWSRHVNEDMQDTTFPRRDLWNADLVENLIFDSIDVQAALVHAARSKFSRPTHIAVQHAIRKHVIPEYRGVWEKDQKEWVHEMMLVNPDYIKEKNADGTPSEAAWTMDSLQWKQIQRSMNRAVNLIAEWAMSCFASETMFWAGCMAGNMSYIQQKQESLKAPTSLGFAMKGQIQPDTRTTEGANTKGVATERCTPEVITQRLAPPIAKQLPEATPDVQGETS